MLSSKWLIYLLDRQVVPCYHNVFMFVIPKVFSNCNFCVYRTVSSGIAGILAKDPSVSPDIRSRAVTLLANQLDKFGKSSEAQSLLLTDASNGLL